MGRPRGVSTLNDREELIQAGKEAVNILERDESLHTGDMQRALSEFAMLTACNCDQPWITRCPEHGQKPHRPIN